jgi:peptidoglycan hydrolase-like protein with peptidoglycan-binding domain
VTGGVESGSKQLQGREIPLRAEASNGGTGTESSYCGPVTEGNDVSMAHPEEQVAISWLGESVAPMPGLVSRIAPLGLALRAAGVAALAAVVRATPRLLGVETLCGSLGVVAALTVVVAILSRGPGEPSSPAAPVPGVNHLLETDAPALLPELPKLGEEVRPAGGLKQPFTQANVRYCLFQEVRLEAVRALTDSADLALFNLLVSDWNSRCGRTRYLASDKAAVDRELVDRRTVLEVEGRSLLMGWRRNMLKPQEPPAFAGTIVGSRGASPTWEVVNGVPTGLDRSAAGAALPPVITGQALPAGAGEDGWGSKEPSLMLLHAYVAARVQKRLNELGYTNTAPDGAWGPMSRNALRHFKEANGLLWDDALDRETVARLFSMAAVSATSGAIAQPDDGAQPFETAYPPPSGAKLNPLNRADSEWIQQRLADLGYYEGDIDGLWGIAARNALHEFKTTNHLSGDDEWDAATELALKSEGAVRALDSFAARWPARSSFCSAAPVVADDGTAKAGGSENAKSFAELANLCRQASANSDLAATPRLSFRPTGATSTKRTSPREVQKPPVPLPAPSWLRLSAAAATR